jgi:hypothetical protein
VLFASLKFSPNLSFTKRHIMLDLSLELGQTYYMESILEELIADFHERSLPTFTRRHIKLPWLPNKIDAVIGMRRSGKTWFVFQVISDLLSRETPKEAILSDIQHHPASLYDQTPAECCRRSFQCQ